MANNVINETDLIDYYLEKIGKVNLTPLDFLPRTNLAEKLIELDLTGVPADLKQNIAADLTELREMLQAIDTDKLNVVVLGGGTGLSNIIGGDSKLPGWLQAPFHGLKSFFPKTRAVVCVTDDGGSTGELLKDLPLIGLGDIRRVLLSSIQRRLLRSQYNLDDAQAAVVIKTLFQLFNYRYINRFSSADDLLADCGVEFDGLPEAMKVVLQRLISHLFDDPRFTNLLNRCHCLGNLLIAVCIYVQIDSLAASNPFASANQQGKPIPEMVHLGTIAGLQFFCKLLGANPMAVLPCTTTQARLQMLYSNGVLVTGEHKSANVRRNYPVDRVFVEFDQEPIVPPEVISSIRAADIILLAPGSLYTSTMPILQVPGIAEEIRANKGALKVLISNLWVQKGETDVAHADPARRFYVSDLISSYHRNIPAGVKGLFEHVLALGLRDIPGSILQSYALEEKVPIYLDRGRIQELGFSCIEAGIFSQAALAGRRIVQHDPDSLARAIRTLWIVRHHMDVENETSFEGLLPQNQGLGQPVIRSSNRLPHSERFAYISNHLQQIKVSPEGCRTGVTELITDMLWKHADIHRDHLNNFSALTLVSEDNWKRSQKWDNVFSFYDPECNIIKIRRDMLYDEKKFEIAFLIALGQSLLGNYAERKEMVPVIEECGHLGKIYKLTVKKQQDRLCYFSEQELDQYLHLTRMVLSENNKQMYTRLINGTEGFTPPGLLFGLIYAWYLDNSFSTHIEYKMAIMKNEITNLIPEQVKSSERRKALVDFFRMVVFRRNSPAYNSFYS
jgi:uncharacterized cofD-like protein